MMATSAIISEQQYRELALTEEDRFWKLWDGVPVEKPWMSIQHNAVAPLLAALLIYQLDRESSRVTVNGDRARVSPRSFDILDVIGVPTAYQEPLDPHDLGTYADPLPLVVEVWSPMTGDYDIAAKLPRYRERGDLEIWFIHPYEHTLTAWRRQSDGTYAEARYTGGIVPVASLTGMLIDLDDLLRW